MTAPLVFTRREYRPDSGGAGTYRGGLGQVIEVVHAQGAPFVISKMFDRVGHPAQGRQGGGDGAAGRVYIKDDGKGGKEGARELRGKGQDIVPAGATLVMETPAAAVSAMRRSAIEVRWQQMRGRVGGVQVFCCKRRRGFVRSAGLVQRVHSKGSFRSLLG